MMQQFAPKGAKLNNEGTISAIMEDRYVEVEFPLEGDNHSQVAPYPANICQKITH